MPLIKLRQTLSHVAVLVTFLIVTSFITTKLLTYLPTGMQPSVFMLIAIVYWLMLDNITFANDLNASEHRMELHRAAEQAAVKIAVGAVASANAAGNTSKRCIGRAKSFPAAYQHHCSYAANQHHCSSAAASDIPGPYRHHK